MTEESEGLPVHQAVGNNYPHRIPVKTVMGRGWSLRGKPVVGAGQEAESLLAGRVPKVQLHLQERSWQLSSKFRSVSKACGYFQTNMQCQLVGHLAAPDFEAPGHEVHPHGGFLPGVKSLPGQAPGKVPASSPPSCNYLRREVLPTVLSPTRISRNWKSKTGGRGRCKKHRQSRAQSLLVAHPGPPGFG